MAWIRPSDAIDGDYNSDGLVNGADYVKWRNDFGKFVAQGGGADGNRNGIVDQNDYAFWRSALGGGPGGGTRVIPEPAALILLLWGFLFVLPRRMKRIG